MSDPFIDIPLLGIHTNEHTPVPTNFPLGDTQSTQMHPWEKRENPESYYILPMFAEHPDPARNILGTFGGNTCSYEGRTMQVDTESDLRGITRPLTYCPQREYAPMKNNPKEIVRTTTKGKVDIKVAVAPLESTQMWSYPAILTPEPMEADVCKRPEKF